MLEFDVLQSGLAFLLLLAAGDLLSRFTRGTVPAVLFAGVGYTLLCWAGILPGNLVELAGFSALTSVVMMLVVVHMGASLDFSAFLSNWRVAALSAVTFAGQLAALFLVVGGLYGLNTAVGGLPGGMATASRRTRNSGKPSWRRSPPKWSSAAWSVPLCSPPPPPACWQG